MRRNILITGATGNQASGLIRSFLQTPASAPPTTEETAEEQDEYYVYALTRRASSTTPRSLGLTGRDFPRLRIVQGDLDQKESIARLFRNVAENEGGFWGVFVVLAFPGLGVDGSGEERQGKMMADLALEFGVKAFIYSSAMRLGEKYEKDTKYSALAKIKIEEHCRLLGEKGLPWTILQPGFFMENLEGLKGSIAVAIMKKGLKPDTTISFVAAEDVGNLAAAIFQNFEPYRHKSLLVVSEFVTLKDIEEAHLSVSGKSLSSAPTVIGWGLNKGSTKTRELMVNGLELNHKCRSEGDYANLEEEMQFTKTAYSLESYRDWKSRHIVEERGLGSPLSSPLSGFFRRD